MKTESNVKTKAKRITRRRIDAEPLEGRALFAAVSWIAPTSGDFNNPANWSTGQVPGVNDDVTINNPAIVVTIDNGLQKVNSLTTNASIVVTNGYELDVGDVTSFGAGINLEAGATIELDNNSDLVFSGTQSLSGSGTVHLANGSISAEDVFGDPGATLTIGSGITIEGGSGTISQDDFFGESASTVVQGNVIADTPGGKISLDCEVTGTVEATAGEIDATPQGPMILSGTGTLDLGDGANTSCLANLTRDGGTLIADQFFDSGPVALNASTGSLIYTGFLTGNTVTSTDGAQLICEAGTTFDNVTLGPGSPIDIATNSAALDVGGTLTLMGTTINLGAGSINFRGSGAYTPDGVTELPQVIAGSGTFTMGVGSSFNVAVPDIVGPTTLQISPNITIDGGGGSINVDGADQNLSQTLINQGTISADTPGQTITITPNNGSFTSTGTLEASNGGTLAIQGDYAFDSNGTTNIGIGTSGAGTVAVSGAATLAGTLNVSSVDGQLPPGNQTYNLLTYGSETGSFSAVNLATPLGSNDTTNLGATAFTLTTPPPTIGQLTEIVTDDRTSVSQSKSQRKSTLHDLVITRNQQQKTLGQTKRSLAALIRQNRRHPSDTLATEIAADQSQVESDSQALTQTRQTLSTDIHTDFTGTKAATKRLSADLHSLHQAKRSAKHGG